MNDNSAGFTPSISVITPVWNGLPYLEEAAESVLGQSLVNWEWIVSDDGSTDGSREYLMEIQQLSSGKIRLFFQSANLGIFGNLNFLVKQAHADLIQVLCQDDFFCGCNTLSLLLERWQSLPESVGASCWNSRRLASACGVASRVNPDSSQLLFFLHGNIPGNLSNVAFRKSAWMIVGPFDQRFPYAGDFYYWALFAMAFSFDLFDEEGVCVRQHDGQASCHLNERGELYSQISQITSQIYKRMPRKNWISDIALRLAGTVVYDCAYRRGLMLRLLAGKLRRYKMLAASSNQKNYLLPMLIRWPLFGLTLGGLFGKGMILAVALKLNTF